MAGPSEQRIAIQYSEGTSSTAQSGKIRSQWLHGLIDSFQVLYLQLECTSDPALLISECLKRIATPSSALETIIARSFKLELIFRRPELVCHSSLLGLEPSIALNSPGARVREYIETNLTTIKRLEDISHATGMSRRQMCYAFRREYDGGLHGYIIKRRLQRACRYLISTDLKVSAVAMEVGFSSRSAFHRAFRRLFGRTPAAWRRLNSSKSNSEGSVGEDSVGRARALVDHNGRRTSGRRRRSFS